MRTCKLFRGVRSEESGVRNVSSTSDFVYDTVYLYYSHSSFHTPHSTTTVASRLATVDILTRGLWTIVCRQDSGRLPSPPST